MEDLKIILLEEHPEKVLFSLTEVENEDNTYTYEVLHKYGDKHYHLKINNSIYHLIQNVDKYSVQLFNIELGASKFMINYWSGFNDKLFNISLKDFTDEELIKFIKAENEIILIDRFEINNEYVVYTECKSNIDNSDVYIYSKYSHNLQTGYVSNISVSMDVNTYSQEEAKRCVDNIEVIN